MYRNIVLNAETSNPNANEAFGQKVPADVVKLNYFTFAITE